MSQLNELLCQLRDESCALGVLVVSEEGSLLAWDTGPGLSAESLSRSAIRSIGGIEGLARQLETDQFGVLYQNSPTETVYITALDREHVLAVFFEEGKVSPSEVQQSVRAIRGALVRALDHQ